MYLRFPKNLYRVHNYVRKENLDKNPEAYNKSFFNVHNVPVTAFYFNPYLFLLPFGTGGILEEK